MSKIKVLVINCFIETMEEMDHAIIHNSEYDVRTLLNSENSLLAIAGKYGDVVPAVYLEMVGQSLSDLIPGYNNEFYEYYVEAVSKFREENELMTLSKITRLNLANLSFDQLEQNCLLN